MPVHGRVKLVPHDKDDPGHCAAHQRQQQQRSGDTERSDDQLGHGHLRRRLPNNGDNERTGLRLSLLHGPSLPVPAGSFTRRNGGHVLQ